jgi:hypothetical protein
MDIRPIDLPDLRTDVSSQFRDPSVMRRMFVADGAMSDKELADFSVIFSQAVGEAEMYHVAPAMTQLAFGAAESLEIFSLQPEDVPDRSGIMVFAGDDHLHATFTDGCTVAVHGYLWFAYSPGVTIVPLIDPHGPLGRGSRVAADPAMTLMLDYGDEVENYRAQKAGEQAPQMLADVLSTWLLMRQTLALTSEEHPDRATRKRLQRAGHEPKPVRVIELRRPAHSGPGDGSREFHHQWIVRGHWRQQWYPAREVHRPVWIAPHIKGPEGAPLIGGEKVYAWKR